MSDSQPQQAQGGQPQQQAQQQILRADDILKLQCLPDDEKQKYRLIMQNFWQMSTNNAPGSPEHTQARQKLVEWSTKFIYRERQYRSKQKQLQQQQQQQQGGQAQASQSNAATQQIKQEQPVLERGADIVTALPMSHNPQQVQGQAQPQQQPGQGQAQPAIRITPAIQNQLMKHAAEFEMLLPPSMGVGPPGSAGYEAKVKEYRQGYLTLLFRQATLAESIRKVKAQIEERQRNGQEISSEMLAVKQRDEKEHEGIRSKITDFRSKQAEFKKEKERQQGQGQGQPGPMADVQAQHSAQSPQQQHMQLQQPQPPQRQVSQSNMHAQSQVKEEPQIKIEGGQAPQPQLTTQYNMQGNLQQQPQNMQMPPSLQQNQQQQQQGRPAPAPHSQSMPPNQAQQFAQPGQQHHMQQNRPQINPHQANAHQHQNSNSPHLQSATSNAPGPPVPLSHQAAVSAANRSYTDPQRTNTPLQQGGQGNFGSREREQLNNPKMPIPRHLNVTSPNPVHMGQARPTMSGPTNGAPGPMGQPVIPRPPPFQLEGEGDRVLSKRKLDELVRQVTGGSEEALTSEVEEVSRTAVWCRDILTKLRLFYNSQTTSSTTSSAALVSSQSCASHPYSKSATFNSSWSAITISVFPATRPMRCALFARWSLRRAGWTR